MADQKPPPLNYQFKMATHENVRVAQLVINAVSPNGDTLSFALSFGTLDQFTTDFRKVLHFLDSQETN